MKLSTNLLKTGFVPLIAFSYTKSRFYGETFSCKSRSVASMVFQRPQSNDTQIIKSPFFLISILRDSVAFRSPHIGKMAHACISKSGFGTDLLLANNLLHAYCSCLLISDAIKVFEEMLGRDVVSWNTMISGFVKSGFSKDGFSVYCEMKRVGIRSSQSSFASVLVALVEMDSFGCCRQIQGEVLKCGYSGDIVVGNALLTAYVKCGDINESRRMFDEMQSSDEVSFEILLRRYVQDEVNIHDAFGLLRYSFLLQVSLSCFTLSSLLSLCANKEVIHHGTQIHGYVAKVGLCTDVSIVNSLISMYAKSYLLEDAMYLFDEATTHDIVTWNSLIAGCAINSQGDAGVSLFTMFLSTGIRLNESTFSSFLSCCATVTMIESVKEAHGLIIKFRESRNIETDNVILTMYNRCGNSKYASILFNTMEERDTISYNLIIGLFRNSGLYEESIKVVDLIQLEGFKVDEFVFSSLIASCSRLVNMEAGQQIHGCIVKTGFEKIAPLGNSLLEMYSRCGRFNDMENGFAEIDKPDVFSWNTVIMGYANFGFFHHSIEIWKGIRKVELNEFSYCAIIDICSCIGDPSLGSQIHGKIKKLGFGIDTPLMNSLLTMYANCGMMEKASAIFEEISSYDCVSWNALICGYAQNGFISASLKFYLQMNYIGFKPNNMTFASISKACGDHLELMLGLQLHTEVIKRGFELDITVTNSYITMYAKCGDIHDSSKIFGNTVVNRDIITWNSMICAYAHYGCGKEALDTLTEMKIFGAKPNSVTFTGILSACDHAGLLTEAFAQFDAMYRDHGVVPSENHYACMVDILCRAGRLKEAKEMIEAMPYEPCSLIWRTLLSACRMHENVELGKEAAENLMQLEPNDSSAYVLLSNIYASAEKMEEKAEMRRRMGDRSVKKDAGHSWIWS